MPKPMGPPPPGRHSGSVTTPASPHPTATKSAPGTPQSRPDPPPSAREPVYNIDKSQMNDLELQRMEHLKKFSKGERNSRYQVFKRACGKPGDLHRRFLAAQDTPGTKAITELFEMHFACEGNEERMKVLAKFTATKTHKEENQAVDGLMTRAQIAKHYHLPEEHPSVRSLIESAVRRGAWRRHPAAPMDPNLFLYDVLAEIKKTTTDSVEGSISLTGDMPVSSMSDLPSNILGDVAALVPQAGLDMMHPPPDPHSFADQPWGAASSVGHPMAPPPSLFCGHIDPRMTTVISSKATSLHSRGIVSEKKDLGMDEKLRASMPQIMLCPPPFTFFRFSKTICL